MAVKATSFSSLFEKLHVDDPWIPPVPWECIPSESGRSFPATNSSSRSHLENQINKTSLTEPSLVRLTMNALQGVESSLISIDKFSAIFCSESADRTCHQISSLWTWSFSTVSLGNLLKSIGHFGCIVLFLHKFVHHFNPYGSFEMDGFLKRNNSEGVECPECELSLVNQAFAVAVKKVLDGYISALNTIYDSVTLRRTVKDSNGGCLMDVANAEITLLEVYLHTRGLRTQIEALGNICCVNGIAQKFSAPPFEGFRHEAQQEFSNFPKGAGLLTYLYTHLKVADPVHSTLLRFLFQRSFEPYYDFIRSWIYEGRIIDPYIDFVVECDSIGKNCTLVVTSNAGGVLPSIHPHFADIMATPTRPNASQTSANVVNNFNGGAPSSNDEVPAIIFCVALGLTIPLLLWRLISKKHKSWILGNAVLFFILRTAALALRAYMAKHQYTEATLVAELVLTSISYLFLINALIDMWQKHAHQHYDNKDPVENANAEKKARWVNYLAWFLRGMLIASLITAIAGGAILSQQGLNNDQKVTIIRNLVKASYILSLASTAVSIIGILVTHFTSHRSLKKTLFLLSYSIPLLIVGIYRVVEVFTGYRATTAQLAAFWVAMVLFEFIAYCLTLSISIPKWFGNHVLHHGDSDEEKRLNRASESTN